MDEEYEREIFELKNLLEISKSLNSTLDYNILMDSILLTCMGQMRVIQAGIFVRKALDHRFFTLHRNCKGFDVPPGTAYSLLEKSPITARFLREPRVYTKDEILSEYPTHEDAQLLGKLAPDLIAPLISKDNIQGVIILGDKINGEDFSDAEKEYLESISLFAAIAMHNSFLFEMTTTDMMTKLKMRHFFYAALLEHQERAAAESKPLSLLMMDLDHFKNLNDTYGHTFGDQVLTKVASLILQHVRQIDIAARYGGEEFVVLLPDADLEEAALVGERIRKAVEDEEFFSQELKIPTSISIGAAQFNPDTDTSTESLLNRADKALYKSKQEGRNRVTKA